MKVKMEFEIDDRTAKLLGSYSIERMINSTLSIAEESNHQYAEVNFDDWCEWKLFVVSFWVCLQDAIFRIRADMPAKNDGPYRLKGVD